MNLDTLQEQDRKCNALWRELDALKAKGADTEKGGEYDRVLYALRDACRARTQEQTV